MSNDQYLYLFNGDGVCFCRCQGVHADMAQELAQRNGAASHFLDSIQYPINQVRMVDGVLCMVPEDPVAKSYAERRYLSYPPMSEQLDAIWHAMDSGILPRVPAFYDPIAAVKAANPKE